MISGLNPLPTPPAAALEKAAQSPLFTAASRPIMPSLPQFPAASEAITSPTPRTSWPVPIPSYTSFPSFPPLQSSPAPQAERAVFSPAFSPATVAPPLSQTVSSILAESDTSLPLPQQVLPRSADVLAIEKITAQRIAALTPPPVPAGAVESPLIKEEPRIDYSDNELLDSFKPLVEDAVHRVLFLPDGGMDTYLEPMLRATIRRALAEQSPNQRPFQEPGVVDRFAWRCKALFTSKTFEQILFEKTRRFRVEEVYLLEKVNLTLISYASADPARHASARRVHSTARQLADQALDKDGTIRLMFDLYEGRHGIVREGKDSILVTVILGNPNDGLRLDLDYTLRRLEERFGSRFKDPEAPLMLTIQPYLEDCLLIQAPSSSL